MFPLYSAENCSDKKKIGYRKNFFAIGFEEEVVHISVRQINPLQVSYLLGYDSLRRLLSNRNTVPLVFLSPKRTIIFICFCCVGKSVSLHNYSTFWCRWLGAQISWWRGVLSPRRFSAVPLYCRRRRFCLIRTRHALFLWKTILQKVFLCETDLYILWNWIFKLS